MFNIGDEVIVNENANDMYTYSRPGSIGIITNIEGNSCKVQFTHLANKPKHTTTWHWIIDTTHLSLLKEEKEPYSKICRKIKQMEERRKSVVMHI